MLLMVTTVPAVRRDVLGSLRSLFVKSDHHTSAYTRGDESGYPKSEGVAWLRHTTGFLRHGKRFKMAGLGTNRILFMFRSYSVVRFAIVAFIIGTVTLWSQSQQPQIAAVMNAASYGDKVISPGEMVVIFGTNLGPAELVHLALNENGRLRTDLANVRVLFDGISAPLIYVSQFQVSAMVPYQLAGREKTSVQVAVGATLSNSIEKTMAPSAPGIFTVDASGRGQAALTNSDYTFNNSEHPAQPGNWFTFYLTGEGPIDPPGIDGQIIGGTTGLTLPVVVRIAGREARVLYAGSAPGNVNGFAQINAVVPEDLPYGGDLPLTVQIGESVSGPDVTMFVAGPLAPKPLVPTQFSAVFTSANSVSLRWEPGDDRASRFLVERAIGDSHFTEIANLPAQQTSYSDENLLPSTIYRYRVRASNEWGFSPYSEAIERSTGATPVPTPTNLSAQPVSQTEVLLTWTNNAPSAKGYRIEQRGPGSQIFAELGEVTSLASARVVGLTGGTGYAYRVRAVMHDGFSEYSNVSTATTPPKIVVFVLHGLGQDAGDVEALTTVLSDRQRIDARRFTVDGKFDFSECSTGGCDATCSIPRGAQKLAAYIASKTVSNGEVILVGYSMGGLIARELIAGNYNQVASSRKIKRLITLGTPNAGYPGGSWDVLGSFLGVCSRLARDMESDFRSKQIQGRIELSQYLGGLLSRWQDSTVGSRMGEWVSMAGAFCQEPIRTLDLTSSVGCPDYNPKSDGVVCESSASHRLVSQNNPSRQWVSSFYDHGAPIRLLCTVTFQQLHSLDSPLSGDDLSRELWNTINSQ